MRYDVTIIGGGIIGCAIARELMRYRLRALLIDKEVEVGFGVSKANSGIVHAGHHAAPDTLKGRLEWPGNRAWDRLAAELGFGFERVGEVMVAFDDAEVSTLEALYRQGLAKGVSGLELWDGARLRAEEPNLSDGIVAALHAPTAGVVNPYQACFSLAENARRNGLELSLANRVVGLHAEGGSWWIASEQALIETRFVVNAAGLYADQIAAMAGVGSFSIRPRKGEEYLLDRRLEGFVRRVVFPCPTPVSKGILLIPTFDGPLMVGPTAHDVDDKEDLTTTAAGAAAVFGHVRRVAPGISERDCIAEFAGLRAVADTGDFIIGPSAAPGFVDVAGIQSPGLTAAPAIAELVVGILRDQGLELVPNEDFEPGIERPVRVATLTTAEQARLAAADPRFGRIACRCELVTEGEIVDAIHRGARTLDGLKFRTRAGMGRCQGSFCSWRCMQLLGRELALPMAAISKRGGGSWLVLERAAEEVPA